MGVDRVRRALRAGVWVGRVGPQGVEVPDSDARVAVVATRVNIEHSDAVTGGGVPAGRPDRVLPRVGGGPGVYARRCGLERPVWLGENLGLRQPVGGVEAVVVKRGAGTAAAEDQVHGPLAGVEHAG